MLNYQVGSPLPQPSKPSKPDLFVVDPNAPGLEVTILMPCLNEAETLEACVAQALKALKDNNIRGEVLIADNGSTDGSQEIATNAGARVVRVAERGYGSALLGGMAAARGEYILMGDADGSYDFGELPRFLEPLRQGDDLVMGCRLPAGGGTIEQGAMPWLHRWIGNPVLSAVGKLFYQAPVTDFHSGLRAFRRSKMLELELKTTGMEFASEMVVRSSLAKLKMSEVPITLHPDGRSRRPHLRSFRDGWRHLRFLLLYSPKWLFLYPGLFIALIGLFGFLLLLPGAFSVGTIIFDTNTMLVSSVAMILGAQVVAFYLLTKTYAVGAGFLPADRFISKLLKSHPAEWGVGIGVILTLIGFVVLGYALFVWQKTGFGYLSYPDSLRIVIPGITAIALGVQSFFTGFSLALLSIKHK